MNDKEKTDNSRSYFAYVAWRDKTLEPFELDYQRAKRRLEAAQKVERQAWNRYYEERERLSFTEYNRTIERKSANGKRSD